MRRTLRWAGIGFVVILIPLLLVGVLREVDIIDGDEASVILPTPTPIPTPASVSGDQQALILTKVARDRTALAAAALESEGLGVTREEWEAEHGAPDDVLDGFHVYGDYWVLYHEGRVYHLEWGFPQPTPLAVAEAHASRFVPQDAELVNWKSVPSMPCPTTTPLPYRRRVRCWNP